MVNIARNKISQHLIILIFVEYCTNTDSVIFINTKELPRMKSGFTVWTLKRETIDSRDNYRRGYCDLYISQHDSLICDFFFHH